MQNRINANNTRCGRTAAYAAALIVLWSLGMSWPAPAAEKDCDTLLAQIGRTGEVPAIVINPVDETVRVFSTKGACSETIEKWSNREPLSATGKPASTPKKTAKPAPAATPAPAPPPQQKPKSAFTSPPPSQGIPSGTATFTPDPPAEKPKPKPAPEPSHPPSPIVKTEPATGACDYRLQEVWERQIIKIEGVDHYLARAFTLDLDNNATVDNVSFTFFDKDGKKTVLHYFGLSGDLSGRDYPALALPDDSLIGRLCFGESRYEKPKFFSNEPVKRSLIEIEGPDLAGQKAAKDRGIKYVPRTKKKKREKKEEPISWMLWGSIGGLVLIAAGGGIFILRRKKAAAAAKAKDEDEGDGDGESEEGAKSRPDDTDDDEEDGDKKPKKSKFSLAGLFKRGKKKKAADGEDDDADDDADREDGDEEDGDDKAAPKKKSKFSLGGLFKRKKKKKKASDDEADEGADKDDANDGDGDEKDGDDKDGPKKKKSKFSLGSLFKRTKKKKKKKAEDGDDAGE